jgi:hypothetical protein
MYLFASASLGVDHVKALIATCAAEIAKLAPSEEFEVMLKVLEGGD